MQVMLTERDLADIQAMIGDIPHRHAVGLIMFINRKIAEQQKPEPEAGPKLKAVE